VLEEFEEVTRDIYILSEPHCGMEPSASLAPTISFNMRQSYKLITLGTLLPAMALL